MNGPIFEVESFGHDERSTQFTQNGCCDSLVASDYKQPIIVAYIMDAMSSNSMKSSNPHSGFHSSETAKCLDTRCLDPGCNQGGMMICESRQSPLICYEGQNCCTDTDTSFTLQAGRPDDHHIPGICYAVENHPNDSRVSLSDNGIVQSLTSRMGTGGNNVPLALICRCFQNTGQGWWNEGEVAETLRTPCGGDSTKANLVVVADRKDAVGYDIWNFAETGNIGRTLSTSGGGLNEHIPVVITKEGNDESISNDNGSVVCKQPSGVIHRAGCVQQHAPCDREE